MIKHILPKLLITLITIACVFFPDKVIFAETEVRAQANAYRNAGFEQQRVGNFQEAMSLYQKAVTIDPANAVALNDLGVIYESLGMPDRAEETYLTALKADPSNPSTYSNLALFYESKRDLDKAEFYWRRRVKIGKSDDPWTQKAESRLRNIRLVTSKKPVPSQREEEVLGLARDVIENKDRGSEQATLSEIHFQKAQYGYRKGDMATAIKEALDAESLDPNNPEIVAFLEKAELRALSQ